MCSNCNDIRIIPNFLCIISYVFVDWEVVYIYG
ncbi:hypothetical protein ESCOCK445M_14100 [Escherichia coli]